MFQTNRIITAVLLAVLTLGSGGGTEARADDEDWKNLPPGPIRDRIELMEKIGEDAKAINDALKAKAPADAVAPAENIAALMPKFDALFPEGSLSDESRSKRNIWASWDEFEAFSTYLVDAANEVADAARDGGDVKAASRKMFKSCKSCHKKFRRADEDD